MKFYKIPNYIEDLEFYGDKTEWKLFYIEDVIWFTDDKELYEQIEKKIEHYRIEREFYTVYGYSDRSGYEYMVRMQRIPNYIQITVEFRQKSVPNTILDILRDDIRNAYNYFEQFESYVT